MVGGYHIFDLLGRSLETGTPTVIPGAYNQLESVVGKKPIIVRGIVRDEVEKGPYWANIYSQGTTLVLFLYAASGSIGSLSVQQNDSCTFHSQAYSQSGAAGMPSEEDGPSASM